MINTIMFSWKRARPGREQAGERYLEDFNAYLERLQRDGRIDAFEAILLDPNATGFGAFFLIKADDARLGELIDSPEWLEYIMLGEVHLDDPVLTYGVRGDMRRQRIDIRRAGMADKSQQPRAAPEGG